ncbi:hypothetical protein PYCC9005_002197 [Savitreella phatthalungensis]
MSCRLPGLIPIRIAVRSIGARCAGSSAGGGGVVGGGMIRRAPELPESELAESFSRSSGPGGQHVNKTESKVLLKHIPTGIAVAVQESRDRATNRRVARRRLAQRVEHHLMALAGGTTTGDEESTRVVLSELDARKAKAQLKKARATKKSRRKHAKTQSPDSEQQQGDSNE